MYLGNGHVKANPLNYEGGRSLEEFVEYLNKQCLTRRTPDGELQSEAGIFEEFGPLVRSIIGSLGDKTRVKNVVEEFKKAYESLRESQNKSPYLERGGKYYIKVAEKLAQDAEFPVREMSRLKRLLEDSTLAQPNKESMILRYNILRTFAGTGAPQHEEL